MILQLYINIKYEYNNSSLLSQAIKHDNLYVCFYSLLNIIHEI